MCPTQFGSSSDLWSDGRVKCRHPRWPRSHSNACVTRRWRHVTVERILCNRKARVPGTTTSPLCRFLHWKYRDASNRDCSKLSWGSSGLTASMWKAQCRKSTAEVFAEAGASLGRGTQTACPAESPALWAVPGSVPVAVRSECKPEVPCVCAQTRFWASWRVDITKVSTSVPTRPSPNFSSCVCRWQLLEGDEA